MRAMLNGSLGEGTGPKLNRPTPGTHMLCPALQVFLLVCLPQAARMSPHSSGEQAVRKLWDSTRGPLSPRSRAAP